MWCTHKIWIMFQITCVTFLYHVVVHYNCWLPTRQQSIFIILWSNCQWDRREWCSLGLGLLDWYRLGLSLGWYDGLHSLVTWWDSLSLRLGLCSLVTWCPVCFMVVTTCNSSSSATLSTMSTSMSTSTSTSSSLFCC